MLPCGAPVHTERDAQVDTAGDRGEIRRGVQGLPGGGEPLLTRRGVCSAARRPDSHPGRVIGRCVGCLEWLCQHGSLCICHVLRRMSMDNALQEREV